MQPVTDEDCRFAGRGRSWHCRPWRGSRGPCDSLSACFGFGASLGARILACPLGRVATCAGRLDFSSLARQPPLPSTVIHHLAIVAFTDLDQLAFRQRPLPCPLPPRGSGIRPWLTPCASLPLPLPLRLDPTVWPWRLPPHPSRLEALVRPPLALSSIHPANPTPTDATRSRRSSLDGCS
jgi:hypothetical protein